MGRRPPIFLALWALAGPVAASGIDQLNAFIKDTHGARGAFTQTVQSAPGRKPQQSAGQFAFVRPGKFRWTYEKPYSLLLVGDGERLWSYDADLNQVVAKKMGAALGATPGALLAGERLERFFELKEAGAADGLEFVEATPKSSDAAFTRMRVGLKDRQPRLMEIHDNFGQTTTLVFTRFEPNPSLPSNLFHFSVPKGAEVVSD